MPGGCPAPLYTLRGSHGPVTSLLFLSEGARLVVGTQNGDICVWDLETKRLQHHMSGHGEQSVLWMYEARRDLIVSQGRDGWLLWWKWQNEIWSKADLYDYGAKGFCCCAYLSSSDALAVPTDESVIKIISMATKEEINSLTPKDGRRTYGMCMCMRACVLGDTAHVLAGYEDGAVGLWDPLQGLELSHLQLHSQPLMCMDYHQESRRGISGSTDDVVQVWTVSEDKKLLKKTQINVTNPGLNAVCFRGDGKLLVVGGSDCSGHVFSKSSRKLAVLTGHRESIQALAYSQQGLLAVGSKDAAVSLWKLY